MNRYTSARCASSNAWNGGRLTAIERGKAREREVSVQCVVLQPLFPLHVVLFPGAPLPLHVFEPRYREMMADILGDAEPGPESTFGVVCIREGYEVGAPAETHDVGCLATIEKVVRNPDGTMELLVRG